MKKETYFGIFTILPAVLFLAAMVVYPLFYLIFISLYEGIAWGTPRFVGISHYINLIKDPLLVKTLFNTILFTFAGTISALVIGFFVALMINVDIKARIIIRTMVLVPWVIPPVVASFNFKWMFQQTLGLVNYFLKVLGIIQAPIGWLENSGTAMFVLILSNIWISTPFMIIMILAGLQSISEVLYESAKIDGAGPLSRLRYITLPLLKSMIGMALIIQSVFMFRAFGIIYALTGGGPGRSTEVLATWLYREAFKFGHLERSAAISLIMVIITGIGAFIYIKKVGIGTNV